MFSDDAVEECVTGFNLSLQSYEDDSFFIFQKFKFKKSVGALLTTSGSIFAALNWPATSANAGPIVHKKIAVNNYA